MQQARYVSYVIAMLSCLHVLAVLGIGAWWVTGDQAGTWLLASVALVEYVTLRLR